MMADLAALTPPLVICVAFLVGVAMLLRHQLAPKRRPGDVEEASEDPQAETTRGPADPAKPDKPARVAMSRDDANGTDSAGDRDRKS